MPIMLPAPPAHARSLTGVASELEAVLAGTSTWGAARSVVLVVVDGLGAIQLRTHAGHARFLAAHMAKKDVARTVFPSTTAAAITSITTGAAPGTHGLLGYRVLDAARERVVNQLSGWEDDALDPATWQRSETVFQRVIARGGEAYAVGPREHAGSGFSAAALRGAEYLGEDDPAARYRLALSLAAAGPGRIVYCYFAEVDKAGHRRGVDSAKWRAAVETVDAALSAPVPDGVGVLVTADHGMIDAPRHRQILLRDGDPRLDGVRHLAGEPRMVHVHVSAGTDLLRLADVWSDVAADVATREEVIDAGLFGEVDDETRSRIGDLVVAARGTWVFYDDRLEDKRAQSMVGQHGSLTPEETIVPLIRLGTIARA